MIKINLLPYRASKKKETATQQLIIMVLVLVLTIGIVGAVYLVTIGKIRTTKGEIAKLENELGELKKKIGEIDNLKKLQAEVQRKLDILNQLRKGKTGPALRLARLSDTVPEKLWLTKYSEKGANITLSGVAYSEELIADFMRSLQASPEFEKVELLVSEQTEMNGVKLKKFDLTCVLKSENKTDTKTEPKKQ